MRTTRRNFLTAILTICAVWMFYFACSVLPVHAANIIWYSDTLSDSGPGEQSNHTIAFTIKTDLSPGAYFDITPPTGFTILSTSTFQTRNVELYVNGTPRVATTTANAVNDGVSITTGSPGLIRYTLNSSTGVSVDDELEFRIGNHTSNARGLQYTFSTSTGTTTLQADTEPIVNSSVLGRHDVMIRAYDGGQVANADAVVFIVNKVGVGPIDTRETIPPERFNGAPTSSVGGTTLNVEISLETNEFAICRYSTTPGVSYGAMTNTFDDTGLVVHTQIVPVTPASVQEFYVRCIDDEGNFNIDDFLIIFTVDEVPAGTANTEGSTSGDGSGSGNSGTGSGSGSGGTQGNSSGEAPLEGSSAGGGGSGGGSGGNRGEDNDDEAGGGFETSDNAYESGDGEVIISGYAFPGSSVRILVDGNAADQTTANSQGEYEITLEEIARGVYTFGVYGVDRNGTQSSVFSTSFTVTGARTTSLSNVNVMPSILVEPDPVDVGQTLTISGYSIPNANITIENQKENVSQSKREFTTTSNSNGAWSITVETDGFSEGTYKVRAKAEQTGGVSTNFSNYTFYGVGGDADLPLNADLNRDGDVNLIDFSILLFWWGGNGGDSDPPADINRDGTVSLTDFSILLFQWTG